MRRLWVAAVALLLTGCAGTVSGTASVNTQEVQQYQLQRTPLTSQAAFGDVSTVDYCSLLDLDRVKAAGGNGLSEPARNFNYCQVSGKVYGQDIVLGLGYLSSQGGSQERVADPAKALSRGLVAQRSTRNDNKSCTYYLAFPDGVSLQVYVTNESTYPSTSAGPSLCAINGAVLDGAVAKLSANQAGHFQFAPGSLGTVDACTLLDVAEVNAQLGGSLRQSAFPAKHRCRWQDAQGNQLDLMLDVSDGTGSTAEQIGGHATDIAQLDDAGRDCLATGSVAPYDGQVEVANLYVTVGEPPKDACGVARALAGVAWPRLPAT
ncbi:DUF3558 domain-containing protein [Amycolatopsis acidicola]|uniref:DUF3558 domain-containing protein n=1 Tax=Amycolatopsis acidicola TaxID=2596893 RepID=A0A5N0VBU2_9PSEU|nr:DUF3558 family protein [Amycolatopsis acidicola]KAA9162092.1 DUF3558 domain-containing protein [Amycolatopsis acidicola]